MSAIYVCGAGVVSPAGWGMEPFRAALRNGQRLATRPLAKPRAEAPLTVMSVPPPSPRPPFLTHPRLRRTSPISQFAVAAAVEALKSELTISRRLTPTPASASLPAPELTSAAPGSGGEAPGGLGIIFCATCGCVSFSQRFYSEVLKDPGAASPLLFPETVYNAPASHLAAVLGTKAVNYTLVGDPGVFLQGVALAADWLGSGRVESCLVVGAEELDWTTANAAALFDSKVVMSEGAGALYLKREPGNRPRVRLAAITDAFLFLKNRSRGQAARHMQAALPTEQPGTLLCDGLQNAPRFDRDEEPVWSGWSGPRVSPKKVLGEGFMATAGWLCAAAVDGVAQGAAGAVASIVGCNQQAIGAAFSAD